jgi:hypothetical protein
LVALLAFWRGSGGGHWGGAPLMNLSLFVPSVYGSIVLNIYGIAFGSTYLLPVYVQLGLRSASHVGTICCPLGWCWRRLPGWSAGRPAANLTRAGAGEPRFAGHVVDGHDLMASGLWLLVAWSHAGAHQLGFILPSRFWAPCGLCMKACSARGSSAINFLRMLGGAIGVKPVRHRAGWRLVAQLATRMAAN